MEGKVTADAIFQAGSRRPIVDQLDRRSLMPLLWARFEFADFERLYLNRTVNVGINDAGETEYKPVAQVWLRHRDRRQYIGGVTFDPSGRQQPSAGAAA